MMSTASSLSSFTDCISSFSLFNFSSGPLSGALSAELLNASLPLSSAKPVESNSIHIITVTQVSQKIAQWKEIAREIKEDAEGSFLLESANYLKNSGQSSTYDFALFRIRNPVLYPPELRGHD